MSTCRWCEKETEFISEECDNCWEIRRRLSFDNVAIVMQMIVNIFTAELEQITEMVNKS